MELLKINSTRVKRRWDQVFWWHIIWFGFLGLGYSVTIAQGAWKVSIVILIAALVLLHSKTNKVISKKEVTSFEVSLENENIEVAREGAKFFELNVSRIHDVYIAGRCRIFRCLIIIDDTGFEYKLDLPSDGAIVLNKLEKGEWARITKVST